MVFTIITTSTTHQGHQKQLQNLTFLLPATSLPPLRKNGSNIGEDLPYIFLVYFWNGKWKWVPLFPVFFGGPVPFHCINRGFGLRSAHAYILVYDVTSPKVRLLTLIFTKVWSIVYLQSFMFLQFLREQIAISRGLSEVSTYLTFAIFWTTKRLRNSSL